MAASVAVGVGVALARAERDRRWARVRRTRDRQFALCPGERLAHGLRRMALGQLDLAIELLEGDQDGVLAENAVHETRKSLKRLRALIRLLEGELGKQVAARENAVLRDAGQRLAGTRDAEVLVGTLDGLLQRHPGELAHRRGVAVLRARLVAERDAASELTLRDAATRAQVIGELRQARSRVSEWRLSDRDGIQSVEFGLTGIYRQGRRRYRRAARGKGDRARIMHVWRKRVKDLRYAVEMLDRLDPIPGEPAGHGTRSRRRKRPERRREAGEIKRTARRADKLGELLGEEHDLVLLTTRVVAEGKRSDGESSGAVAGRGVGGGTRRILLKLIARRRRRLRRKALRQGERLYRRKPGRFVARTRDAYERASHL